MGVLLIFPTHDTVKWVSLWDNGIEYEVLQQRSLIFVTSFATRLSLRCLAIRGRNSQLLGSQFPKAGLKRSRSSPRGRYPHGVTIPSEPQVHGNRLREVAIQGVTIPKGANPRQGVTIPKAILPRGSQSLIWEVLILCMGVTHSYHRGNPNKSGVTTRISESMGQKGTSMGALHPTNTRSVFPIDEPNKAKNRNSLELRTRQ